MTADEASKHYATMLYPSGEGLQWESARQDFKGGIEWKEAQLKPIIKTLESIKTVTDAALLLLKSQSTS